MWIECAGRLAVGETVTGVSSNVVSPVTLSPLVITGAIASGTQIQFNAAGGLDDVRYKVTFFYTTSSGNAREAEVYIQSKDE